MRYWLLVAALVVGCDDSTDPGDMGATEDGGGVGGEGGAGGMGGAGGAGGGAGGAGGGVGGAGGGAGGVGGMPPMPGRLEACGYATRYVASEAAAEGGNCRAPGPDNGDLVTIDHDTQVIRYGNTAATIVSVDDNCGVRATTCSSDPGAGDFDTINLRIVEGTLRVTRDRVDGGEAVGCGAASAQLVEVPACQLDGRYRVEAAEVTSGMCDHAWAAGELTIGDAGGNGRRVRWLEDDVNVFRFSALVERVLEAECAVEAGGTFVIEGASREQSLKATVMGDAVTLTMQESQDGPDDNNAICPEATFMATAARIVPAAEPGPTDCGRPDSVCGDGECTAGAEDCRTCEADCGCGDGTCGRVGEQYLCGTPCMDGACPPGQRCLVEFPAFEGPTCLPDDGRVAPGGDCLSSLDCASGFVCSCTINWNCPGGSVCVEECAADCDRCETKQWGTEVCERDCSPENPDVCGGGTRCVSRSTNTGCTRAGGVDPWVCYPREQAHQCEAGDPPAFADLCGPGRRCGVGLDCIGTDCAEMEGGVGCETYQCSRGCENDGDCAAPLSYCWRVENRDFGYCIPPLD